MSNRYYLALGPVGDVQELTAESRDFVWEYTDEMRLSQRVASGKLRTQWKAIKSSGQIIYEAVPTATITRLEYLFELKTDLKLWFYKVNVLQTKTVLMEPFGATRVSSAHGGLWAANVALREV